MAGTVWRGHLTFGLVSIPVRLVPAARANRIKLKRVYRPQQESLPPAAPLRTSGPGPVAVPDSPAAQESLLSGPELRTHYAPVQESTGAPISKEDVVSAF